MPTSAAPSSPDSPSREHFSSSPDSPSREHFSSSHDSPSRVHTLPPSLPSPTTVPAIQTKTVNYNVASPHSGFETRELKLKPAAVGSADSLQLWRTAISSIGDMLADYAGLAVAVEPNGSDQWNVIFPPGNTRPREVCEQTERRSVLEQAVATLVQREVHLSFSVMPGEAPRPSAVTQPSNQRVQKMREVSENPYVKKLCEVIDGEILRVDPPAPILAGPKGAAPRRQSV